MTTITYASIKANIQTIDLSTKTLTNTVKTSLPVCYLNVRKRVLLAVESYTRTMKTADHVIVFLFLLVFGKGKMMLIKHASIFILLKL